MGRIAKKLAEQGYILRSGGAEGAGTAVAQGQDIVPLTGTQREHFLAQSAAAAGYTLDAADRAELEAIFTPSTRAGQRYPLAMLAGLGI